MWYLRRKYHLEEDRGPFENDILIGRSIDSDICLQSVFVSRRHCLLSFINKDNKVHIRDLKSSNGVFLNGIRIRSNILHTAQHGDRIGLGISESHEKDHFIFIIINKTFDSALTQPLEPRVESVVISDSSDDESVPCKRIKISKDNENVVSSTTSVGDSDNNAIEIPDEIISLNEIKVENDINEPSSSKMENTICESSLLKQNQLINPYDIKIEMEERNIKKEKLNSLNDFILSQEDEDVIFIGSQLPTDQQKMEYNALNIKSERPEFDDNDDDVIFIGSQRSPNCNFDNAHITLAPFKTEEPIYLSSDEDDALNPWLGKLSQNSMKSPPHETNDDYVQFDNVILPTTDLTNLELVFPDANENAEPLPKIVSKTTEPPLEIIEPCPEIVPNAVPSDISLPSTSNKHQPQSKRKFFKTKLIEPITLVSKTKKLFNPIDIFSKTTKSNINKELPKAKRKRKTKSSEKSTVSKTKNSLVKEQRREKLKELALDEKNKNQAKNNTKNTKGPKPKVKVTSQNRSDNLIQDMSVKKCKNTKLNKSEETSKTKKSNGKQLQRKSNTKEQVSPKPSVSSPEESITTLKSILKSKDSKKNNNCHLSFDLIPKIRFYEIEPDKNLIKLHSLQNSAIRTRWKKKDSILYNRNSNCRRGTPLVINEAENKRLLNYFLWIITNWSPSWLLTNTNLESSFLTGKNLEAVSSTYDTYQVYQQSFVDFLLLETWNELKKNFDNRDQIWFGNAYMAQVESTNKIINTENPSQEMFEVKCAVPVTNHFLNVQMPQTSDVYMIRIISDTSSEKSRKSPTFAYLAGTWIEPYRDGHNANFPREVYVEKATSLLHLTFIISKNSMLFTRNTTVQLRAQARITSKIRQCTAISQIFLSPFLPFFLNPMQCNFKLPMYIVEDEVLKKEKLNTNQVVAVHETCAACLTKEPKICYIQGPPGTGKTSVIVNLIFQLLYGGERRNIDPSLKPRILLCAPSNAAIDNLTLKLLQFRDIVPTNKLKMVRNGNVSSLSTDLDRISLKALTEKHAKLCFEKKMWDFKKKSQQLKAELERLQSKNEETITIEKDLVTVLREINAIKKQGLSKEELIAIENIVLTNADVVCTTLNSCFNKEMKHMALNSTSRFTCCIVDEASQCTEPDLLIPLLMGIDTLVLVGDSCQLPATVLSQEAISKGYSQSFLQRAEKCYKNVPNCPLRFLNIQYRMNPAIIEWPNKYFYNNSIENAKNIKSTLPTVLKPYCVIYHSFYQNLTSEMNESEIELIVVMAKAVWSIQNTFSIGIISPYRKQCYWLEKTFKNEKEQYKENKLYINTIDGCQGQQFDVVIFSCVRTDGVGFLSNVNRINVALTRAKYACYVVGNFQSLQANKMWLDLVNDSVERNVFRKIDNLLSVEEVVTMLRNEK